MASIRTQYRQKRIEFITDGIRELSNLLLLDKKDLERIHIKYFKQIKKTIDEIKNQQTHA